MGFPVMDVKVFQKFFFLQCLSRFDRPQVVGCYTVKSSLGFKVDRYCQYAVVCVVKLDAR